MLQRNIFEPVMKQGFRLRPDILSGCLPFRDRYKFVDLLSSFVSFSFFFFGLGYLKKPWVEETQGNHAQ